jgi:hypothetical protein
MDNPPGLPFGGIVVESACLCKAALQTSQTALAA